MVNVAEKTNPESTPSSFPGAKKACTASEAKELFFGVVGHVGSGTGSISKKLKELISQRGYTAEIVKASAAIRDWAKNNGHGDVASFKKGRSEIDETESMQSLGDEMRKSSDDYAAVAQGVISQIRKQRAAWSEVEAEDGKAVLADPEHPRAYIIDSIRHPSEVNLLRLVYGEAFALVGVVCHEDERRTRLLNKYFEKDDRPKAVSKERVQQLMNRDSDDKSFKYGQHVADSFWESDYFVDNTPDDAKPEEYTLNEDLGRFIDIITHSRIVRPFIAETGMHIAVSSQIRSSCLSRQVGAAIVDQEGNVLAIGSNEVPKSGGGVYGESFDVEDDLRCSECEDPHCSSNAEQNELIGELLKLFPETKEDKEELLKKMRKAGLGGILEFTRAIHAEMDAITTAARRGVSVKGASMFVTTFPCHYCARHLVAAGIDQVQYIEPYPKSRALSLHGDSITNRATGWLPPSMKQKGRATQTAGGASSVKFRTVGNSQFGQDTNQFKVLFKPFVGVAPRLYQRAFTKDRPLKNDLTGKYENGQPEWGGKWGIRLMPYTELEARLTAKES